jgi:mannosyltransferase
MREADTSPRAAAIGLVAIVAGGAAIRFATLGDRSFWVDEGSTVRLMSSSFGHMMHLWYLNEDTPPLFYVIAWVWARAFGTGEVGIRALSAVAGTATIPVAYAATRHLATRRAGLVAALLMAVSALDVWFSQDARSYALLVLVGGLSLWGFARALAVPSRGRVAVWAGASVLAVLTHYFAAYLVAAEAVWLLLGHPGRRRALVLAATAPAVTFLALVPIALAQHTQGGPESFLGHSSVVSRAAQVPAQYIVGFQPPLQVAVSLLAFLAVPVTLWLVLRRADGRERSGALVAATVGGVAVLGPISLSLLPGLDFTLTRYTASALVPLVAALAIGLAARRAGRWGTGALAWLCAFSLLVDVVTADHPKFDHEDWRAAARALPPATGRRLLVVTPAPGAGVLAIYLPGARFLRGAPGAASEIDVIGLPPRLRRIGQRPEPPRPPSPPAPPGFRVVGRRDAGTFTLVRYRAARSVVLHRPGLDRLALSRNERPSLVGVPARRAAK